MKHLKKVATACALSGAILLAAPAAANTAFYMNFAHTAAYLPFDSDNDNIYGNAIEFGVQLQDSLRLGAYHEAVSVETGNDFSISGLAAEHSLLHQDSFAASAGIMLGSSDNGTAADIYGRFSLVTTDHTNLNARLAYRSLPGESSGAPAAGDLNGVALSIGFGINF